MLSRSSFLAAGAAVGALFLLTGCGAANSIINNNIPEQDNLLGLNGQTTTGTVGAGRSAVSGSGSVEVQFADRSLSQASKLNFVKFTQNLSKTITVTVPDGASLPGQFVLSNITLRLSARDDAPRSVTVDKTANGPLTFLRIAGTNQYQTDNNITFDQFEIKNDFDTFRDIVTTAPSPNYASGKVSFDTDTDQLPVGSTVGFTMIDGKAKIGI